MLKIQDKTVYPLELSKLKSEGRTIYDRDTRGKSWFFLCLYTPHQQFMTGDGNLLLTSNGDNFLVIEGE